MDEINIERNNYYKYKLECVRIKEILPDYIHKTAKEELTLTEQLKYLTDEEINN